MLREDSLGTKTKKMMIMAGGTGGHVFPALAVAHAMQAQGYEVSWMGTERGLESKVVPEHGIHLDCITIRALRGQGRLSSLTAPFRLLKALWQAIAIIRKQNPDCVLGMGGFASGPGGLAAWLLRKPLVIHEQNAIPGMTNRILSNFAKVVCESFPGTFPDARRCELTGNPVREDILSIEQPIVRFGNRHGPMRLLVLGGSLGAKAINDLLPEALALIPEEKRPEVWHQAGEKHLDNTLKCYEQKGIKAKVVPFIKNMGEAYAWADCALCRSGALTVAELQAVGLPAILIPYPYAVDDHQTKNGEMLVRADAATMIQERDLNPEILAKAIEQFCHDRFELQKKALIAYGLNRSNATDHVSQLCLEVSRA